MDIIDVVATVIGKYLVKHDKRVKVESMQIINGSFFERANTLGYMIWFNMKRLLNEAFA